MNQAAIDVVSQIQQATKQMQAGNYETAENAFQAVLAIDPKNATALHMLGVVNDLRGNPEEAVRLILESLDIAPEQPEAWNNLGLASQSLERWLDAEKAFRNALSYHAEYTEAAFNLARILLTVGKLDDAESWAKRVVNTMAHIPDGHVLMGNILVQKNKKEEAILAFEQAVLLNPKSEQALAALIKLYGELNRPMDLARVMEKAYFSMSTTPESALHWARVFQAQHRFADAEKSYRKALDAMPLNAEAWCSLGVLLMGARRVEEAQACFTKALAIKPDYMEAKSFSILALLNTPTVTAKEISEATLSWCKKYIPSAKKPPLFKGSLTPGKKLRIGILSADMHNHPVGSFLFPTLATSNQSQFEWVLYYNNKQEDFISRKLQEHAFQWHNVSALSHDELAKKIQSDQIDILIELNGHTAKHRLEVMAKKPAPVQMTWLGFFGTTGVEAIDYIIADRCVIKPGEEALYSEKPLYMPDAYLCFAPMGFDLQPGALPFEKNGYITFGSLNYLTKISDATVRAWAAIMKQVEGSKLLVRNPSFADMDLQAQFKKAFQDAGIDASRIQLDKGASHEEFLRTYQSIDIALDTFPHTGGTTTVEALWMGVPVVTHSGDRFVSRVSETILTQVGLDSLVSTDEHAWVKTAVALAKDTAKLSSLRAGLRDTLLQSNLCNANRFTANFENLLRTAWVDYTKQFS